MRTIIYFIFILSLVGCGEQFDNVRSGATAISVSTDGKYILSAHHGKLIYLWDIASKSKRLISDNGNIYSPYFINNSDKFIWQSMIDNSVHIEDISGHAIKVMKVEYPSYGQIISDDLATYIEATKDWDLYSNTQYNGYQLKKGFGGYGKMLDLSLVDNTLLSVGSCGHRGEDRPISDGMAASDYFKKVTEKSNYSFMSCITLYDVKSNQAIKKISGNMNKTHATLSPDGQYVVSGDENGNSFVWRSSTGEQVFEVDNLWYGKALPKCSDGTYCKWDNTGLIKPPKDYCERRSDYECTDKYQINAVKFINTQQYLRFSPGVPYAVLFDVDNRQPKAYYPLGQSPKPDVYGYTVSHRIATAPKAGILVMAQAYNPVNDPNKSSGIIVYKYDEKTQTLKKIWAPEGPKAHRVKRR